MANDAYQHDQHTYSQYADAPYDPRYYDTPSTYPSQSAPFSVDDDLRPRSRAASNAPSQAASESSARYGSQSQPLQTPEKPLFDTINHAFDQSDATSQVDPNIIAQITEQVTKSVINQFKVSGIAAPQAPYHQQTPQSSYIPRSPAGSTAGPSPYPPRNVYTPPSPDRHDSASPDKASMEQSMFGSRDFPPKETLSSRLRDRDTSPDSYQTATSRPRERRASPSGSEYTDNVTKARQGRTSPDVGTRDTTARPRERRASPDTVRPREASRRPERRSSPPHMAQTEPKSASGEETTLEKIWQPLFDFEGQPTARLGQFLRGLAIHLIEDYEPKRSIVVTPPKMLRFYEEVRLAEETHPWKAIWALPNASICKMYRDLKCQHHLIQDKHVEIPTIPALTPVGFETWMTLMIQAYPDAEFERLQKAVQHMPISNSDDSRERFPKDLSRRLFPKKESREARQRCSAALAADGRIPLPKSNLPPPPPSLPPGSFERERKPYSGVAPASDPSNNTAVETDDEDAAPSIQIERERKPYTAKEGTGKFYPDNDSVNRKENLRPDDSNGDKRHHRQSTAGLGTSVPSQYPPNTSRPQAADPYPTPTAGPTGTTRMSRSGSMYGRNHERRRSVSNVNGYGASFTRSDTNIGSIPQDYYTSNMSTYSDRDLEESIHSDSSNRRFAKEAEAKRNDWDRRQSELDGAPGTSARRQTSDYPANPRSVYDDDSYYRSRPGNGPPNASGYGSSYGSMYPPPRY